MTDPLPLDAALAERETRARELIAGMGSALVALSGGVDSSLVLALAATALPGRVRAVTARSVLTPPGEADLALRVAGQYGVPHHFIDWNPLDLPPVAGNAEDRCYHCKTALLGHLRREAAGMGLDWVLDGSNADDAQAHRPGRRALEEQDVRSPLMEAGLSKAEVRALARRLGLPNADRPAQSCLATRLPYGRQLTHDVLRRIAAAETLMHDEGFPGVRARVHGDLLRIEAPEGMLPRIVMEDIRSRLVAGLSALGFRFVTLDLAGFRSGSFDTRGEMTCP